jgi:hypothetical protein
MTRRLPPIPRVVIGILGPIKVRRVRNLCDENGRECGGLWYAEERVIHLALGQTRERAYYWLYHEHAHATFDDFDVRFPGKRDSHGDNVLEERACNAVASARLAELLAG